MYQTEPLILIQTNIRLTTYYNPEFFHTKSRMLQNQGYSLNKKGHSPLYCKLTKMIP